MRDPVSINAPYYALDTGWAVRPGLQLTVQELAVCEEGAGEPGQPGDQEQGAGGEQNPPDINNMCEGECKQSEIPVASHALAGDAAGVGGPGVVGVEGELVPPQGRGGRAGQEGVVWDLLGQDRPLHLLDVPEE